MTARALPPDAGSVEKQPWSRARAVPAHDTVVGSGDTADVAIMMVEAEATTETITLVADGAQAPTEDVVASGLEAAKPEEISLPALTDCLGQETCERRVAQCQETAGGDPVGDVVEALGPEVGEVLQHRLP